MARGYFTGYRPSSPSIALLQNGALVYMLERSQMLAAFVEQMAKINHGRAFFATPERLGEYVLVDYVSNKRRAAS